MNGPSIKQYEPESFPLISKRETGKPGRAREGVYQMMKTRKIPFVFLITLLVISCDEPGKPIVQPKEKAPEATEFQPVQKSLTGRVLGQTVYVPVYSSIYHYSDLSMQHLTATLSLRNISLKHPIIFTRIDYYDTNGKLLRSYIDKPFQLGTMATKDFVIREDDVKGGTGANFIVEWESPVLVSTPLIETVMVGVAGTRAFAFTSRGKEIESH